MRRQKENHQHAAAGWTSRRSSASRPAVVGSEDIHIRNYDHQQGYDLSINIVDTAGETVFVKRYYLQPGLVESELDILPTGDYEIRVTLDNHRTEILQCRIDSDPANTVVIEVGNGALSLTEGLTP